MNFQNQVRGTMRTQVEIEAERRGEIVVFPTATKTESECFPCIAIEVRRHGQRSQRTWLDLRKLGTHFDTLDAALDAAKKIRVLSVDDDGEVQWEVGE